MTSAVLNDARCVGGAHKQPPALTHGLLCSDHAADVRELISDVHDLALACAEGDVVNPEPGRRTARPHAPIPIRLDAFLISHPGGEPVERTYARNANPNTGRLESNGPDAPDVRAVVYHWVDQIATDGAWPAGDTLAKLVYLRARISALSSLTVFPLFVLDMKGCRRALAAAVGEDPGPPPVGQCPHCHRDLYTDRDAETRRRRRAGQPTTGDAAAPNKARVDRVACRCGAHWEGVGLVRLKLILEEQEAAS